MKKIGIITYHAAYNFGSVLQAFATQKAVERLGYNVEIINYRPLTQDYYYKELYRKKYGTRFVLGDLTLLPIENERKQRAKKYEKFISKYLNLSDEYKTYEEVKKAWNKYDVIISGSDQIWNPGSHELAENTAECIKPYLLHGYEGGKISYASSIGPKDINTIQRYQNDLLDFDFLSMREPSSALFMQESLVGKEVRSVCDPTLLLNFEQWNEYFNLSRVIPEDYILYYSLYGTRTITKRLKSLKEIAKENGIKLLVITPFAYVPFQGNDVIWGSSYDPEDYLKAIKNAKMVVTDSYHGTAFALNFEKDFYSVCYPGGTEFRKTELLSSVGLQDRILPEIPSQGIASNKNQINIERRLKTIRDDGMNYLSSTLKKVCDE